MTAAVVTAAVEGDVDEAVLAAIGRHLGVAVAPVYITGGKSKLLERLPGFNSAAERSPWVVLVDLDQDAECAARFARDVLPVPARQMYLRVAVRAVEAWLLADRGAMADFLAVSPARLPEDPDRLDDPKGTVVGIARHSRRRAIRDELVPRPGSGRAVGENYAARMIEFAGTRWRPDRAARCSDSLRRALTRLHALRQRPGSWR